MKRENITNPGKDPVEGDWIRDTYDSGMIKEHQFHASYVQPEEEKRADGRAWRNRELELTDFEQQCIATCEVTQSHRRASHVSRR